MTAKMPAALNPMKWIQLMDVVTTAAIWNMAKQTVEGQQKLTQKDGESYWKAVTDLYEQAISETQPMYDTLHRPEALKTTNKAMRILFAQFQTQPLQNSGVLFDAFFRLKATKKGTAQRKQAARRLAKAATSQTASALVFCAMTLLAKTVLHRLKPYRDDESGEVTAQATAKRFGMDVLNTVSGVVLPLVGSKMENLLEMLLSGESLYNKDVFSDPTAQAFNDFLQAIAGAMQKPGVKSGVRLVRTLGDTFGIPVGNLANMAEAVLLWAADTNEKGNPYGGYQNAILQVGDYTMGYDPNNRQIAVRLGDAVQAGDEEKAERVARAWGERKSEDSINSALNSVYKPQYREAFEAGDETRMDEIRQTLEKAMEGAGAEIVPEKLDEKLKKWAKDAPDNGEMAARLGEAVADKDLKAAKELLKSWREELAFFGDEDSVRSKMQNALREAYKEEYIAARRDRDTARAAQLRKIFELADVYKDLDKTLENWMKEEE